MQDPRRALTGFASERLAQGLYALLVFAALPLCALTLTNKTDPDLWMHLRAGRQIVETRDVPRADLYSFVAQGRPWVSHEWLFQLLAYRVFAALGSAGLMAAKGLLGAATMACLYGAAAARAQSLAVRAFVFLTSSLFVVTLGFTARPHVFTLFFISLIALLLTRNRKSLDLAPWILLPWSWLHGGFVAGIAFFGLIAVGEVLSGRRPSRLLAHLMLATASTAINPYGLALWSRIAETLTTPGLGRAVVEWQPVWTSGVPLYRDGIVLFGVLLGGVFAADKERRVDATPWLLAGAGLAASILSVRHLLLLAILAVPALAGGLERLRSRTSTGSDSPRPGVLVLFNLSLITLLAGLAAWVFYEVPIRQKVPLGRLVYGESEPGWVTYPKGAADFLRERGVKGRLWSDVNVGGYLVWHLSPSIQVFMDPRYEHVYTPAEVADYGAASAAVPGWEKILDKYAPDLLLLPVSSPLAKAAEGPRWKPVYRDPDYVLLAGSSPTYAGLVKEFARDPKVSARPPLPWLFP
ncbi:MAG: hypothetical protein A2V88_16705 [Elusimicrobia bacterium RBG_16_66_12]|nr:MAG: hypothetical protein A2V88_16705 [Elusimicrobia bacterium RBG_16_66_12]